MAGIKRRRAIVLAALIMLVMSTAADASPATGLIGGAVGSGAQQAHAYATNAPYDGEIEGEEYEPLTAVLKLSEEALPEPGACPASITLTNVGDDVIGDVMLLDAEGNVLWGPRDLDLSGSYTWRGTLDIDEDALSAGVVNCSVSYVLAKGDPLYERHITRRVSAAIERASVQPALEFSRSQSMTYAQPGQSVTLTYTVKNTGNIPLTGIKVSDPLFGVVGELDTLAVDEKKTFTQRVTVGTTALTSTPQVSYSFEGSQDIVQKDIASSSIKIAKPSLEVALESDATLVNPGDTVMLRCKLINNGNVGYRKIQLSDQVLGDLGFIDDLRAGKDTVYAKAVRIQSKTTFKFTITASDTTGSDVTAVSNSLTIDVVSRADEESLTLSAQPDRTSVASGDTVNFTLLLCNGGTTDISGIDISERTRGPIAHVDVLRAGESLTVNAQYTVTGYEMFTFSATMTQQDGATREALAGPITISLGAPAPTSVPTAQPSPTPAATMAPSVMRAYDAAFSRDVKGNIRWTVEDENLWEVAVGGLDALSLGQWAIWEAVYGPVDEDGYPARVWDPLTGEINKDVVAYWQEHFDLNYMMQNNWEELGPKLVGKIHLRGGDMDGYYLNLSQYLVGDFLDSTTEPAYEGYSVTFPRTGHTGNISNKDLVEEIATHMIKYGPENAAEILGK